MCRPPLAAAEARMIATRRALSGLPDDGVTFRRHRDYDDDTRRALGVALRKLVNRTEDQDGWAAVGSCAKGVTCCCRSLCGPEPNSPCGPEWKNNNVGDVVALSFARKTYWPARGRIDALRFREIDALRFHEMDETGNPMPR